MLLFKEGVASFSSSTYDDCVFKQLMSGKSNTPSIGLVILKSAQIRSYFWSLFSCILSEDGDLQRKSPYSVRIQENTDQK